MQIVMGEKEKVAGLDLYHLAPAGNTSEALSIRQEMKEDHVIGVRQLGHRGVEPVLRLDTPGRGELGVDIDRPV
jgi:hypothetical protein